MSAAVTSSSTITSPAPSATAISPRRESSRESSNAFSVARAPRAS